MNINDKHGLLRSEQNKLLKSHASDSFNIGVFSSLDDILTRLRVDVHIEPGITKRIMPTFITEALAFWEYRAKFIREEMKKASSDGEMETLEKDLMKVLGIIQQIQGDMQSWTGMPLRGLYDPVEKVIKLYPEEMHSEYGGTRTDELLVSTLAHETMHAYFDRPGQGFASVPTVEEPLAEFGMLLYLNDTRSAYYGWAYDDVKSKRTCYKYGADIMDQYLTESSPSPTRRLLEAYKFKLEGYPVMMKKAGGVVLCTPPKVGPGVKETPIGKIGSKLSLPIAPPPFPSATTVVPKGTIVVRKKILCQFIKEVFIYLEGEGLLNALGPYIVTKQSGHLRALTNGVDFNLTGILYDTSSLPVDADYGRMFLIPFVINGDTYYLSREWYGKGKHSLLFDGFVDMIEYVYSSRFDIKKVGDEFVMIE